MMSAKMNVPELRFGEFSGEWEEKRLGSISEKISDGIHSTPEYAEDGLYYFVNGNNLVNGKIRITNNTKKVNEEEYLKHKRQLGDNTILLSINGTIGNLAFFNNEKIVLGKSACYINIDEEKTNKYFINDILKTSTVQNFFYSEVTGSTIKNLSLSTIKNTKLSLPSKPEQEKIASFLSSVDSKIEQLSKKRTLLEQYKKGVMQKIFSQELRFKEDDGSEFPEWVEKKLGDTLEVVVDNRGKTPPTTDFGIPLIEVNAIGNKEINYLKVSKYVTENTYKKWFRKYLKDGDILFSTVGQTAICSIYDESVKAVIAQNIIGLRFVNELNLFMYYLLTEIKNHHKFKRIEMGAVQPSIKVSQMIHINFYIPSLKEQTKIATFLSSLDKKIELTDKEFNATKEFKKGLLQKMFV